MNRVIGRLAVLVALGLSAFEVAQASDIDCKSAPGGGSVRCEDQNGKGTRCALASGERRRSQQLLCDNAQLATRYERMYAEQQKLLRTGVINDADVNAWRIKRDACDSTSCLESLYHQWWRWRDSPRSKPAQPLAPPSISAAAPVPVPPKREPTPPAVDRETPARPPVMQESLQPAKPAEPAVPVLPAAASSETSAAAATENAAPKPALSAVVSPALLTGFAAFSMGAGFLWKRRRDRRASPEREQRPAISAAMAIFYGLLIVNVLLLPFTLGLS